WGEGHLRVPGAGDGGVQLQTPDQGLIRLQAHGDELEFRAVHWPTVHERGFKRSFSQVLTARVNALRGAEAIARDLERRLLAPYAVALREARARAATYRRLI